MSIVQAIGKNFLGNSPNWYKLTIILFISVNPLIFFLIGNFIAGWILIAEFIFTLAMALKCYPLPTSGLLAIESVIIGMASPELIYKETLQNFPVILLLMFMVAGIFFMQDLLLYIFARLFVYIRSKTFISLTFVLTTAFLSAFLDALTVTAVIIAVTLGFYTIYHKFASDKAFDDNSEMNDNYVNESHRKDLDQFRGFLRNLLMHAAIGTALGGALTLVGEPQNLIIGHIGGWNFAEFFIRTAPVSIPVFFSGILMCFILEKFKILGYGYAMPEAVRTVLRNYLESQDKQMDTKSKVMLFMQAVVGIILIISLGFHVAEVGLIGLMVIILLSAFNGIIDEHQLGRAFQEALPFTALLVVFFVIVAVINNLNLFKPIISAVLSLTGDMQSTTFYMANGLLSAVSDNVFVATVYSKETVAAFHAGILSKAQFEKLLVTINMGTNIPSMFTPNGQAAFLFLLTSAVAPLIRLSYLEMVRLAAPYAIVLSLVGLLCVHYLL